MAGIVTAKQVVQWTGVDATEAQIEASGHIPIVQHRICAICNQDFSTRINLQGTLTFNATARTIARDATADSWDRYGFAAGDTISIYNSYRNDGHYEVLSITTVTMTLVTGSTVVDELSGRSILVSLVHWPEEIKHAAALMVAYDYEHRNAANPDVASESLGPYSVAYQRTGIQSTFGYPSPLIELLTPYRLTDLV